MRFELCHCQTEQTAKHGRFINDTNGYYGVPVFSVQGALTDYANRLFERLVRDGLLLPLEPNDDRTASYVIGQALEYLPEAYRQTIEKVNEAVQAAGLPLTNQEAWDGIPREKKKPIRDFYHLGHRTVHPKDWPGAYETPREAECRDGRNPPGDTKVKCDILAMLYEHVEDHGAFER